MKQNSGGNQQIEKEINEDGFFNYEYGSLPYEV